MKNKRIRAVDPSKTVGPYKKIEKEYFSFSELQADVERCVSSNNVEPIRRVDTSFCYYSLEDSVFALKTGWAEGDKKISAVNDSLSFVVPAHGWGVEFDVTGDYWDVGRVVEGVPECAGLVVLQDTVKKELILSINVFVSSHVDQGRIINRGAAFLALIDTLENQGYSVKPKIVCLQTWDCERTVDLFFNVDSKNGFSRDLVSFLVCHPGFRRRFVFGLRKLHGASEYNSRSSGHYRRADNEFHIPSDGEFSNFHSIESSRMWVVAQVEVIKSFFKVAK